jgi:hypothetical protein|nr:ORF6N domain-containing protein [Massilia eurypsychrophila]
MSVKPVAHLPVGTVTSHIRILREQKVLLDSDLAALYGVTTNVLVQQSSVMPTAFPATSCFSSTPQSGKL